MRKLPIAIVGLVALVVTSVAIARGIEGARTATAIAGTFSATAGNVTTKSCTTSDGKAITITKGTYTGTAAGDAPLAGAITLRARSIINTTDNVGTVSGQLKVDVSSGRDTEAMFSTVYSGGSLAGLATGRGDQSGFVGNLSATFSPSTGFTNGKIGGGTSGGAAVAFGSSSCNPSGPTVERSEAHGTISSLSSTSITVAGLTCAIPSSESADAAKFAQGDTVQIQCTLSNGQNTLTQIKGKSSDSGDHNGKHHH